MNEDKYQLDSFFLLLFLREAPCSCVSVCDCTRVLPQSSGVADVSSPPSLNLVNQPGTPRTPGDATDVILTIIYSIGIGRTNMHRLS